MEGDRTEPSLTLRIVLFGCAPPFGRVDGVGCSRAIPFEGWLGLLHALYEVVGVGPGTAEAPPSNN